MAFSGHGSLNIDLPDEVLNHPPPLPPRSNQPPPLPPRSDNSPSLPPRSENSSPLPPRSDNSPPLPPRSDNSPPLPPRSNNSPPLPPRKLRSTPEKLSEDQHRNGKPITRLPESVDLMTFPDDNNDTYTSAASWDVCSGNTFDSIIPECILTYLTVHSETNETPNGNYTELERNDFDILDKYFVDDLFKQSSDFDYESKPLVHIPDFSTCSRGIDDVKSTNGINLTTLQEERLQNQSDIVTVPTKSTTHLKDAPLQPSRPRATEDNSDSASSTRSIAFLNNYFRANSNSHLDPPITFENIQDYYTESEEQNDICDTPTVRQQDLKKLRELNQEVNQIQQLHEDIETPEMLNISCLEEQDISDRLESRQQAVYLEKLRELEKEVNQIQQLQKDGISTGSPELLNMHHRKLSSRLSVSDSDIYESIEFESNMLGQDSDNERVIDHDMSKSSSIDNVNRRIKNEGSSTSNHQHDMRASSSCDNFKTKSTTKHKKDGYDGKSKKFSIKVGARVEPTCPCEKACQRVQSLASALGGFMWVSFQQCSLVSLYDNKNKKVQTFDTRGSVDSMVVSATGVLYVSCPPQKRIIMLSLNLQMTVLGSFSALYPRGVAVSPDDGTVVVCMTSQAMEYDVTVPSKNSCLMRFKGETPNEKGTIVNKGNHFEYPIKVTINRNGFLLVSDIGLRCLCVLDKAGNMLRTFSSLGGASLWRVHALTRNNTDSSFLVVYGGGETLSITRLGEYLGTFEEKWTSRKYEHLFKQNVETASMNTDGKILVASGNIITHVSLVNS